MKVWLLVILGFIVAGMLKDLLYVLARKIWTWAIVPAWEMVKPRPGGKLWAAVQAVKGN